MPGKGICSTSSCTRRANTVLRVTDVVAPTCYVFPRCSPVGTRTKVTQVFGVCVTFVLPNLRPRILTRACYVLPECSPVVTPTFVTQMFAFRKRISGNNVTSHYHPAHPPTNADGWDKFTTHSRPSADRIFTSADIC